MDILLAKEKSCLFAKERHIYMKSDVCSDCQVKFGRRLAANLPCLDWGRNTGEKMLFSIKKLTNDKLDTPYIGIFKIINVKNTTVKLSLPDTKNFPKFHAFLI